MSGDQSNSVLANNNQAGRSTTDDTQTTTNGEVDKRPWSNRRQHYQCHFRRSPEGGVVYISSILPDMTESERKDPGFDAFSDDRES
ncbi:hypothetical protein K469DRAFT_711012, partial [Zopfia rhizophila CBS 207.26]